MDPAIRQRHPLRVSSEAIGLRVISFTPESHHDITTRHVRGLHRISELTDPGKLLTLFVRLVHTPGKQEPGTQACGEFLN